MAKYYGKVGYAVRVETKVDVWKDGIEEREYAGDLMRNLSSSTQSSGQVNDNINISHQISIVADPFAFQNFHLIKYIEFMGTKWKVTNVEVSYPRLILTTGGIYNGKT